MGGDSSDAFTRFLRSQIIDDAKQIIEENHDIVNETDDEGNTLFHRSFGKGKEFVMLLIEKGVDVNQKDSGGYSPLSYALGSKPGSNFDQDLANVLIDHGADINELDADLSTFLAVNVERGNLPVAEYLVGKNAKGDTTDKQGRTPLHVAIQEGNRDIIKLLVESYPNILHTTDNEGNPPLEYAFQKGNDMVMYVLGLQNVGASDEQMYLKQKGGGSDTALHLAVTSGSPKTVEEVISILIKRKNLNTYINFGGAFFELSPLQYAFAKIKKVLNRHTIIAILIQNGADIKYVGGHGITTLHLAAYVGDDYYVEYCLNADLGVNPIDIYGDTPLHNAALKGHIKTVSLLLKKGADRNIKNSEKETPYDLATNPDIQKMLIIPSCGVCNASA